MSPDAPLAIELERVSVRYGGRPPALDEVTLRVPAGRRLAILGPSGAGKTTLLKTINGLAAPSSGSVRVGPFRLPGARPDELRALRQRVAVVFQDGRLVGSLTALTNVLCGSLGRDGHAGSLLGLFPESEKKLARELLARVGLEGVDSRRADSLSGGERQRVAIARALMQQPRVLLVDEPLANLDVRSAQAVLDLLLSLQKERSLTLIWTLHDLEVAREVADDAVGLRRGRVAWSGPASEIERSLPEIFGEGALLRNVLRGGDHA